MLPLIPTLLLLDEVACYHLEWSPMLVQIASIGSA